MDFVVGVYLYSIEQKICMIFDPAVLSSLQSSSTCLLYVMVVEIAIHCRSIALCVK